MIYVTGDLHGANGIRKLSSHAFPDGPSLTKDDYVVILGDFGLIWQPRIVHDEINNQWEINPEPKPGQRAIPDRQEEYWLDWLNDKPWTTLFIDGNHENFDRLLAYPVQDFHGGKASQIHNTVWYLRRGEVFDLCGYKCFVMGGAASVDQEWREPGKNWWPQEVPSQADLKNAHENLALHNDRVDLVFTHTCPLSVKAKLPLHGHLGNVADKLDFADPTEDMLEGLLACVRFTKWYFGHFHLDHQIDEKFTCVFDKVLPINLLSRVWDPIRGLTTEEHIAALLDAAAKDGDPNVIEAAEKAVQRARKMRSKE